LLLSGSLACGGRSVPCLLSRRAWLLLLLRSLGRLCLLTPSTLRSGSLTDRGLLALSHRRLLLLTPTTLSRRRLLAMRRLTLGRRSRRLLLTPTTLSRRLLLAHGGLRRRLLSPGSLGRCLRVRRRRLLAPSALRSGSRGRVARAIAACRRASSVVVVRGHGGVLGVHLSRRAVASAVASAIISGIARRRGTIVGRHGGRRIAVGRQASCDGRDGAKAAVEAGARVYVRLLGGVTVPGIARLRPHDVFLDVLGVGRGW